MTTKIIYKVTFKGVIYPGFDKQLVIDNVHKITRIPKQTISRKFFSGKTVVIRRADSQDYANQLQKVFSQAGIETYIEKFQEVFETEVIKTSSFEEPADKTNEEAVSERIEPGVNKLKSNKLKIIVASVSIIVVAIVLTFLFKDETPPVSRGDKSLSKQNETNNTKTHTDTGSPVVNKDIESSPKDKPAPFFLSYTNTELLTKLTAKSEFYRFLKFTQLLEWEQNKTETIKRLLSTKDGLFVISNNNPAYIYRNSDHEGIIFSKNKKSTDKHFFEQLKKQLEIDTSDEATDNGRNNCADTRKLTLLELQNHILITSSNDDAFFEQIKKLSQEQQLEKKLSKLNILFPHADNNIVQTFNFYYHNKTDELSLDHSQYFSISSSKELFWIQTRNIPNEEQILNYFSASTAKSNKISSIKSKSLFQLSLLLMAQDSSFITTKNNQPASDFKEEKVITLSDNFSLKNIKPYQKKLDIEFNAQWQSGPFAITTNQLLFDKYLIIELLAKGQNIKNLMEYSRTSEFNTHSVLTKNGDNILLNKCSVLKSDKHYFRDHEGEQEAFINDDFISYHVLTAKNKLNIKSGYTSKDIDTIKGNIKLRLPKKIDKKSIKSLNESDFIVFDNFKLILNYVSKNNTLTYSLVGKTADFLTIRSYNSKGHIVAPLSLKRNALIHDQINQFQQTFPEEISSVEIFYSNENESKVYPFSFKPELMPDTTSFNTQDLPEIPFTGDDIQLAKLSDDIQQDNPPLLGEKVAQQISLPFYINLFMQKNNTENKEQFSKDAVINIKTDISKLISQNLSAVKLTLNQNNSKLLDSFISFTPSEFIPEDSAVQTATPEITPYLNSNTAFQSNQMDFKSLHGLITLNLPTEFKTHQSSYLNLGQVIELETIKVTAIQIDKHQVKFSITGEIENLVQLKLYNSKKELISEPVEFEHLKKNEAILSLRYNDKIDFIKLTLAQKSIIKKYPFSFSK